MPILKQGHWPSQQRQQASLQALPTLNDVIIWRQHDFLRQYHDIGLEMVMFQHKRIRISFFSIMLSIAPQRCSVQCQLGRQHQFGPVLQLQSLWWQTLKQSLKQTPPPFTPLG